MSLFPEIDKHNKQFEADFKRHIEQLKNDNPRLSLSVSELYCFEESHCEGCSKDDGDEKLCEIIGFMAMNGEHEDVLIVGVNAVCLREDGIMNEIRNTFMKGWKHESD